MAEPGIPPPDLDRFFHPRTIGVVGASDAPGKPTTAMWRRLAGFAERTGASIHAVNPNRDEVDGVACLGSIDELPEELDLVAILVGDAVAALEEVLRRQPRFAMIFAAGFSESGADGAALETQLEELVRNSGTRLLGPNTNLNAFEDFRDDLPGRRIALITQSGHQGRPIFQAQQQGLALSHWAPTGNEVDLEFADFARYFADQPEVGVIAAYIEGFKDGETLRRAADHAAVARVPIVAIKVGRTEEGASMAQSHTGHLTGSDRVTTDVFRHFGITRVDGLDELQDTAMLLARAAPPRGDGVCIYAISGGTGAHMADLASAEGLRLPDLTATTQRALHQWIAPFLRVSNPVDNGGGPSGDWRGRKILDAIVADPNVHLVICPITGALEAMSNQLARDLVDVAATTDKAICVIWGSPLTDEPAYELLVESQLPVFRTFGNCVRAVKAYFDHHAFVARHRSPFARPVHRSPAARKVAELLVPRPTDRGGDPVLSELGAKQILDAYGIKVTHDVLCGSASEAAKAAGAVGFPVVMKACGPGLVHKSDLGLVRTGLLSAREVKVAFRQLADAASSAGAAVDGAAIDGVIVCETVAGGVETVVGMSHDELFGPTVMFGLGGVFVEVFEDVAFRVPPFDRAEARRMVEQTRGARLLRGVRGHRPADVAALVDAIMRVQRLAVDHAETIHELDINPLVVRGRGEGVIALDALVVLRS